MKILVVSNTAWDNNNSFGNSFSNIFDRIKDIEVANIYCRNGFPYNNIKGRFFHIDEKRIFKSIWNRKIITGYETVNRMGLDEKLPQEGYYDFARKLRFRIFFWIRDIIWALGRWKTKELDAFIEEFQPDIMFQPVYYSTYINRIVLYLKKKCNVPMICYISDDNYSLRHFSLSPMYWIERLYKRRYVKKTIDACDFLYVISDIQKKEYDQIFKKPSGILTKCKDFKGQAPIKKELNYPLKLVYTGNIDANRGRTISELAQCIGKINSNEQKIVFDIYTQSSLSKKTIKSMETNGVYFKNSISITEIERIQNEADILVLAEPLNKRGALEVHQSFSTKIVDYLYRARCILSIGHPDCGSIDYFLKNNAALVACSKKQIRLCMEEILNNEHILIEKAQAAWNVGMQKHQRVIMQNNLMNVLKETLENRSEGDESLTN